MQKMTKEEIIQSLTFIEGVLELVFRDETGTRASQALEVVRALIKDLE